MKITVIGATGGSGRAAVESALHDGHAVVAFARSASTLPDQEGLTRMDGDVMNAAAVSQAIKGSDVVVVTLGIRENPLKVQLFGPSKTTATVRSAGTAMVIEAMKAHGIRRLVVQSSYGVGETRDKLKWIERLFFALLIKAQIADTEVQERFVRESGLDWTLVQPVTLTAADGDLRLPKVSLTGEVGGRKVSRSRLGTVLLHAIQHPPWVGRSVAVSGG